MLFFSRKKLLTWVSHFTKVLAVVGLLAFQIVPQTAFAGMSYSPSQDIPRMTIPSDQQSYMHGGVISLSTFEEPAIGINSWQVSGTGQVVLYKANEEMLLRYLTHDKDNKQNLALPDVSTLEKVTELTHYIGSSNDDKLVLPLQGSGIWYMTVKINDQAKNDVFIVRSKIAALAKQGKNELVIWTSNLEDKRKLPNASLRLYNLLGGQNQIANVTTDADGVGRVPLNAQSDIVIAQSGEERALIPINLKYLNSGYGGVRFQPYYQRNQYFLFTDRPLYRPGDKIYFKSVMRDDDDARYTVPSGTAKVSIYKDWDASHTVFEKTYPITPEGTIYGEFTLPENATTGYYTINVHRNGTQTDFDNGNSAYFQVEHFRKPEYSVEVNSPQKEIVRGDELKFTISGSYFSGQPLAGQSVHYTIEAADTYEYEYYTENVADFDDKYRYGWWSGNEIAKSEVSLNEKGEAQISLNTKDFTLDSNDKYGNGTSKVLTVQIEYEDQTGNPSYSRKNVLMYPGEFSIYRKEGPYVARVGDNYTLPLQLKGRRNTKVNNISLDAELKLEYWVEEKSDNSKYPIYSRKEETFPNTNVRTNAQGEAVLNFKPPKTGSYTYTISSTDQKGNQINKKFSFWVIKEDEPWYSGTYTGGITLTPDKPSYAPGETAKVSIYSTVPNRDIFLSLQRGRIDRYQIVSLQGNRTVVSIPIIDTDMPNIFLRGGSFSGGALQSASTNLSVAATKKKLNVTLKPNKTNYGPGETVTVDVTTKDNNGTPVSADVAVWSVDKAIFELVDDYRKDIFGDFWRERWEGTQEANSLEGINVQAAEGGGGCFVGDTTILMADGSTKLIKDVKAGEYVLTKQDEYSDALVKAKVLSTHKVDEAGYLIINGDLKVTPNHILWINNTWLKADQAQVGDVLKNADNEDVTITSIEWINRKETVYNLEVEKYHTFFANNVWVHNQKGDSRSIFKDTAYWNPAVRTNDQGVAQVRFTLPDNLTTWVLAGVANTTDTKVGQTTAEIVVSKELVVRPVLPNLLRVGDQAKLSALVHNFTDSEKTVNVTLTYPGVDTQTATQSGIVLGAQSNTQLFWDVKAEQVNEKAQMIISAETSDKKLRDSITQIFPVVPFGFYDKQVQISNGPGQFTVKPAKDADKQYSTLTLSLSPTLLGTLPTAMKYLVGYPYGCVEQTTSRLIPTIIASKNPELFGSALEGKNVKEMIDTGINRLATLQQGDGGWGMWSTSSSDPYVTAYVVEYLLQAKAANPAAVDQMLDYAKVHLRTAPQVGADGKAGPDYNVSVVMKNYALTLMKDTSRLISPEEMEGLDADILSYAVMNNVLKGEKDPNKNGVNKLLSLAHVQDTEAYWSKGAPHRFGSDEAATALAIRALTLAKADRAITTKAVRFLTNKRRSDYWSNTFATSQVTQALIDFSQINSEDAPNYSYRVLLDGKEIKAGKVSSALKAIQDISLPVADLKESSTVTIEKQGDGQLYSTLIQNQFHTDPNSPAESKGLTIKREYWSDKGEEYTLAVGDTVTVRLEVSGLESEHNYAVIEDHLPAGLIPINTSLKNEEMNRAKTFGYDYISDQDFLKDGVVLSLYSLRPGVHVYTYKARVISVGTFNTPPATVELMYSPEIRGRSRTEVVRITEKPEVIPSKVAARVGREFRQRLLGWWQDLIHALTNPFTILGASALLLGTAGTITLLQQRQQRQKKQETEDEPEMEPEVPKE